ncbi:hypothetical protein ACFV2X_48025 [Streptomyces sp. NPDC059679]|uniref:hypothetical protein n=1 Tax=Streptomyces sp. NPDC059679 TaxID=3346903 RepID=UPI0036A3CE9B
MNLQKQVRQTFRELRKLSGETMARQAAGMRYSDPAWRRKVNGGQGGGATIGLETIERACAHYGMTPVELLGFPDLHDYQREALALRIRKKLHTGAPPKSVCARRSNTCRCHPLR